MDRVLSAMLRLSFHAACEPALAVHRRRARDIMLDRAARLGRFEEHVRR